MEGNAGLENKEKTQSLERSFLQRVEDRFNLAFGEVLQEDKPQIHAEPFLYLHKTRKDSELLDEEIEKADIYIPEVFGWRPKDLKLLRKASSAEISRTELTEKLKGRSASFRRTAEDVYDSQKAIAIIDVPANHQLKKESDAIWNYDPPYEGGFSEALNYTRTFLDNIASHLNKREEYILSQITPEKVEELLHIYPLLKDKKTIKILLSIGLGHSLVPPDYPESTFTDQGIITRRLNREVDDDLAAKIFLESFFDALAYTEHMGSLLTNDSRKLAMLKRKIIGELNLEDAQRIFNSNKGQEIFIFPRTEFYRIFNEKGIKKIPSTEKELDEFLAKPPADE